MSDRNPREQATGAGRPARETTAGRVPAQTVSGGAQVTLTVPGRLDRYKLLALLGQGGMGSVYKAHDTRLDRVVALKVPHLSQAAQRERFFKEARAAALLDHPNICPVFDIGEADGVCYMTMGYIEGKPLSELIRQGQQLPERTAAVIVRQLAMTMQSAHERVLRHQACFTCYQYGSICSNPSASTRG